MVSFTDATEDVQKKLESTKVRIKQALDIANSPNIPDTAPELTRLGAYQRLDGNKVAIRTTATRKQYTFSTLNER